MATTNLFSHPVFKDGAFTANDPKIRRHALRKTLDAIDLGGRARCRGVRDVGRARRRRVRRGEGHPRGARLLRRGRQRVLRVHHAIAAGVMEIALEPKPNEPRGNLLLPTVGHALAFIDELEFPEMVGLNPEFAHETMSGLSFHHAVAQVLWADKLFHIDLNGQVPGKYDQDFRFGSEGVKDAFYLVKLLEDAEWDGMRHFDAHAVPHRGRRGGVGLRPRLHAHVPDPQGEGASGSPRTPRSRPRSRPRRSTSSACRRCPKPARTASSGCARRRSTSTRSPRSGCGHERLDQLVTELLLGVADELACRSSLGVDSSTQSTKVEVRDADSGRLVGHGWAPHPPTSPPRSEQDPEIWWRGARHRARRGRPRRRRRGVSVAAQQHGLVVARRGRTRCCARRSSGTTPSRPPTRAGCSVSSPAARRAGPTRAARSRSPRSRSRSSRGCTAPSRRCSRGSPACCSRTTGSRWRLTGELGTDRGDASGTGYWSPADRRVPARPARDRRRATSTGRPRCRRSSGPRPRLGTGDNMAAALGLGLRAGDVAISLGTSGTVFSVSDTPTADADRRGLRLRRRHRSVPPARLHAERDQGHRRDRAPARRRPPGARRDGAGHRAAARAASCSSRTSTVSARRTARTRPGTITGLRSDCRARAARPQCVRRRRLRAARRARRAPRDRRGIRRRPAVPRRRRRAQRARTGRSSPTSRNGRSSSPPRTSSSRSGACVQAAARESGVPIADVQDAWALGMGTTVDPIASCRRRGRSAGGLRLGARLGLSGRLGRAARRLRCQRMPPSSAARIVSLSFEICWCTYRSSPSRRIHGLKHS